MLPAVCCALQDMGADEFTRHMSSLVSNKLTSDTSLGQEADRAWEQVRGGGLVVCLCGGMLTSGEGGLSCT
jgi:hypothetical protein